MRAANTASAIRDGLPRDVVESIRQGRNLNPAADGAARASADAARAVAGLPPLQGGSMPLLSNVPADSRVSVVGVYEAAITTSATTAGANRIGGIRINVMPGNKPIVLVLTSYEPVRWTINAGTRKIAAILLSGYNESSVTGQGNAQVLKIGSTHAYKMDSSEYARLKQDVGRYVANPIQSFQGGYKGQEFSVN